MGWLDDLNKERVYNYARADEADPCEMISGTKDDLMKTFNSEIECSSGEVLVCPQTSYKYVYAGFQPIKLGLATKIVFEKNGRKAVRMRDSDGKTTIRSMTRENYMKGKGVKVTGDKRDSKGEKTGQKSFEVQSSLTKGCREASNKAKAKEVHGRLTGMKANIEYQNHLAKEKAKGKKK